MIFLILRKMLWLYRPPSIASHSVVSSGSSNTSSRGILGDKGTLSNPLFSVSGKSIPRFWAAPFVMPATAIYTTTDLHLSFHVKLQTVKQSSQNIRSSGRQWQILKGVVSCRLI